MSLFFLEFSVGRFYRILFVFCLNVFPSFWIALYTEQTITNSYCSHQCECSHGSHLRCSLLVFERSSSGCGGVCTVWGLAWLPEEEPRGTG